MDCNETRQHFDDYIDDYLTEDIRTKFESHINECRQCYAAYQEEMTFRKTLAERKTVQPSEVFSETIFQDVVSEYRWKKQKQAGLYFAGAMAASLVVWLTATITGILPGEPTFSPDMTLALNEVKYINLVVGSASEMDGARLTLQLPEKIHIVGYQGQKELSWTTNLKKGNNLLTLPVKADKAGKTVLEARVEHNEKTKIHTFHLVIENDRKIEGRLFLVRYA